MTIEEAISHCEDVAAGQTEQGECPECAAEHRQLATWLRELMALRARSKPLDRSLWKGCQTCKGERSFTARHEVPFCPMCGRPTTEEAWAELEQRIGGNNVETGQNHSD